MVDHPQKVIDFAGVLLPGGEPQLFLPTELDVRGSQKAILLKGDPPHGYLHKVFHVNNHTEVQVMSAPEKGCTAPHNNTAMALKNPVHVGGPAVGTNYTCAQVLLIHLGGWWTQV